MALPLHFRRVVVTGMGILSPLGIGVEPNWKSLIEGRSGIDRITKFDCSNFPVQIAGEVKNFQVEHFMPHRESRRMDLFTQYGLAAAIMAVEDAHLEVTSQNADRRGVLIGSGIGGIQSIQKSYKTFLDKGAAGISPFFILQAISNLISGYVSIKYDMKGPNSCVVTACSTGAHAIGDAFRLIREARADVMVAGGAEAAICELGVSGFAAMRALSIRNYEPQKASRPFDKNRDGFVMADGAAVIVLEELESAKKRGASIVAEMIGYGFNSDASHITNPSPNGEGGARCMKLAIDDARLCPSDIGYINAHGTSTDAGDIAETHAIKTVFEGDAKKVSISSTKSMTGHMLGAAGSSEAIFSILALKHQVIPPTINLDEPDPQCDLDYTPHEARDKKLDYALSNSFGFGGTNAGLIFKRFL